MGGCCSSLKKEIEKQNIPPFNKNNGSTGSPRNGEPEFLSLNNKIMDAYVIDVYDGDTITIVINLYNIHTGKRQLYKWKCRLAGIDTPEIRTKNQLEKISAQTAKNALESICLYKIIKIKCGEFDKYGRLLIWIFTRNLLDNKMNKSGKIYVNEWMIEQGYAKSYNGGKKEEWKF